MSVLYSSDSGFFVSHEQFINTCYFNVSEDLNKVPYKLKKELFKILTPYTANNSSTKSRKRKLPDAHNATLQEIDHIKKQYKTFRGELVERLLLDTNHANTQFKNVEAAQMAQSIYEQTGRDQITDACGGNNGTEHIVTTIQDAQYLIPKQCRFYCKDVHDINQYLSGSKYNFIVLDPPWWNKFVRRKKKRTEHGYRMMYCEDLKNIPIGDLLSDDGLVAIWCTNSQQHMNSLLNDVFSEWGLKLIAKLFWLKITASGEPVCSFSSPNGKQPFEQIILACKSSRNCDRLKVLNGKIIVSVPSALHSHKPPLEELLKPYLPDDRNCLEVFARYLLPNWSSYGLEVLRFQHLSLYEKDKLKSD